MDPTHGQPIRVGLELARQWFVSGDLRKADSEAASALDRVLDDRARSQPVAPSRVDLAVESALWAVRGGVAVHEGRLDDAKLHFERSRESALGSGSAAAIGAAALNVIDLDTRRGSCDAEDPRLEEAARATADAPQADILVKLLIERALAATRAGTIPAAIALYDRAIGIRPDWPFPWYQRGWARFLGGDAAGALEDYRECARLRSPFFTVLREIRCLEDVADGRVPIAALRSYCFLRDRIRERPAAVAQSIARLLERHPDFAPGHLLLAEAAVANGDPAGARESVTRALSSDPDPDTAAAALFLEWNLARAEQDEAAVSLAEERLLEAYRGHPPAEIVHRLRGEPRDLRVRWTWALDGTFRMDEEAPEADPRGGTPRRGNAR